MNSKTRTESKLKIVVALAVAAALFFTPAVGVDAAKTKKATLKKLKARKKYYIRVCAVTKVKNPFTGKTETIQGKWVKVKKPIKAKK